MYADRHAGTVSVHATLSSLCTFNPIKLQSLNLWLDWFCIWFWFSSSQLFMALFHIIILYILGSIYYLFCNHWKSHNFAYDLSGSRCCNCNKLFAWHMPRHTSQANRRCQINRGPPNVLYCNIAAWPNMPLTSKFTSSTSKMACMQT